MAVRLVENQVLAHFAICLLLPLDLAFSRFWIYEQMLTSFQSGVLLHKVGLC